MACGQHAAHTCRLLDTALALHCISRDSHLAGLPVQSFIPDINSLPGYITPIMLTDMGLHSA